MAKNRRAETVKPEKVPIGIVRRDEQEFREWLATPAGFAEAIMRHGEGQENRRIGLETYQREFLQNRSSYRCVEKSRRVGYSWLFAVESVARAHLHEQHTSLFVSYNLADAKEKLAYCQQLHEDLPLEYQKKKVTDSKLEIAFASNSRAQKISRIVSNPSKAPRGKGGDCYLDELAHYADDRTVYQGSTATILRNTGQLTICSTPLGRRGIFWEIATQEVRPYTSFWRQWVPWWLCSFFCVDVPLAAREAPALATLDRVEKFGTQGIKDQLASLSLDDFQQEFEVHYADELLAYYPYELILPCTDVDLEVAERYEEIMAPRMRTALGRSSRGRFVAGFDVGRRRDSSELAVFEQFDDEMVLRMSKTFDQTPFASQEGELRGLLETVPIARLSIDQNGLGMQLCENLKREYPQVIPETFSTESKEVWATDFKIALQKRMLRLPRDRELVSQIHSIRRHVSPAGRPTFEAERGDGKHHGDKFWACALACRKEREAYYGGGGVVELGVRILGGD